MAPDRRPRLWHALHVEIPDELEDALVASLAVSSLGVEVVPTVAGRSRLCVVLANADDARNARASAIRALARHRLEPDRCGLRLVSVEDGEWVARYQERLRPFPLGNRFLVVPGERMREPGSRIPLRLVPGRAFGTGEHETTRLCAEALERWVTPGSRWLDLGTGSGILALIAAHLGADRVDAVDADPDAIEVAEETIAGSTVSDRVSVRVEAFRTNPAAFDGIVANVSNRFFSAEGSGLIPSLRPRGVLVLSGFLLEDEEDVVASIGIADAAVLERRAAGEWGLLVVRGTGG